LYATVPTVEEHTMTTQQIERPLSEVDETAEGLQGRTDQASDPSWQDRRTDERPAWDARPALDVIQRVAQDPASLSRATMLAVGALATIAILLAVRARRRPSRTAEDLLLERSREAFDRARETLDSIASRLSSIER
jgi:hypothetical protein